MSKMSSMPPMSTAAAPIPDPDTDIDSDSFLSDLEVMQEISPCIENNLVILSENTQPTLCFVIIVLPKQFVLTQVGSAREASSKDRRGLEDLTGTKTEDRATLREKQRAVTDELAAVFQDIPLDAPASLEER